MAPMPTKLRMAIAQASYNGRYEGLYPAGDKPGAGVELAGDLVSNATAAADLTTVAPPVAPAITASRVNDTTIRFTFTGGSGANVWVGYRRTPSGAGSYTPVSLTVGQAYYDVTAASQSTADFYVAASNAAGTVNSSVVSGSAASGTIAGTVRRAPQDGDIYVSPSGTDSNSGTSTGAPRSANISAATLNLLSAGKYLWLLDAGTYTIPAIFPNIGGTSNSARINIAGAPGVTTSAVINITATAGITLYGTSGTNFKYWTLRDCSVNYAEMGFQIGDDGGANGRFCDYFEFNAVNFARTGSTNTTNIDNAGAIMMRWSNGDANGANHTDVINCRFIGNGSLSGIWAGNQAGIINFRCRNFRIIGCYFENLMCPIYSKHNHDRTLQADVSIEIANNFINGAHRWVAYHVNLAHIHDNVYRNVADVDYANNDGVAGGDSNHIHNETFYNSNMGMDYNDTNYCLNNYIHDIVFAGTSTRTDNYAGAGSSLDQNNAADHNFYAGSGGVIRRNAAVRTVAAHQAAFPGNESSSDQGTITFVGGSDPGASVMANWALSVGSKGYGTGTGGINAGVNASKLLTAAL